MKEEQVTGLRQSDSLISTLTLGVATGLGFGYSPFAPGTIGCLWGLPLTWVVSRIPGWPTQVGLILALCFAGIPLCSAAARRLGKKDPGEIVWDEIASLPIVFLWLPAPLISRPEILLIGFVLHRVFDISKLPPVRNVEKLPAGAGIMADDVVAALYACLVLHGLLWLFPWLSR